MTDNRTNEPTEAQVRAAAHAVANLRKAQTGAPAWFNHDHARAALVAAQGAAPQAESADCDRDRMGICKRCGMGWDARKVLDGDFACPVLPSSTVDEDALAQVIYDRLNPSFQQGEKWLETVDGTANRQSHWVARAVVAYLRGES